MPISHVKSTKSGISPTKRRSANRTSSACQACKKRKTKCTGYPVPCQVCQTLGTECIIDHTLDMRRKTAMVRVIDESNQWRDSLIELIRLLRHVDASDFDIVIKTFGEETSRADITTTIERLSRTLSLQENTVTEHKEVPVQEASDVAPSATSSMSTRTHEEEECSTLLSELVTQLRSGTHAAAENALRCLIPADELSYYLRNQPHDSDLSSEPMSAVSGRPTTTVSRNAESEAWNPVFEAGLEGFWGQLQTHEVIGPTGFHPGVSDAPGCNMSCSAIPPFQHFTPCEEARNEWPSSYRVPNSYPDEAESNAQVDEMPKPCIEYYDPTFGHQASPRASQGILQSNRSTAPHVWVGYSGDHSRPG